MNLLQMVQEASKSAAIPPPFSLSETDADSVLLTRFLNDAGSECARRVDWGGMRVTTTISGTGAADTFNLPGDYDRLCAGLSISASGNPLRGSLTQDEWNSLTQVIGIPRYFYLTGARIGFFPYMRTTDTAKISYLSKNWAIDDAGTKPAMVLAEDRATIPDDVLIAGAVWRWRRHVGKDFSDYVAEFEAILADRSKFDGGGRQP
jgi:hypothetical protein